jgi:hypothetical protein
MGYSDCSGLEWTWSQLHWNHRAEKGTGVGTSEMLGYSYKENVTVKVSYVLQ